MHALFLLRRPVRIITKQLDTGDYGWKRMDHQQEHLHALLFIMISTLYLWRLFIIKQQRRDDEENENTCLVRSKDDEFEGGENSEAWQLGFE